MIADIDENKNIILSEDKDSFIIKELDRSENDDINVFTINDSAYMIFNTDKVYTNSGNWNSCYYLSYSAFDLLHSGIGKTKTNNILGVTLESKNPMEICNVIIPENDNK